MTYVSQYEEYRAGCADDGVQYVVFLEEDFMLTETIDILKKRLFGAIDLLESNTAQVVRLRHRINYGEPMWAKHTWQNTGKIEETHELWR